MTIKSTCETCIFATYDNSVQTGCRLGRLDKFAERGVAIHSRLTEDNRNVFVIERFCSAARNAEWVEGQTDPEATVRKELEVACHVYVLALGATFEDIAKTLHSLTHQQPKPTVVEVLVQGTERPGKLILQMQHEFPEGLNWKVRVLNSDETNAEDALDRAVPLSNATFYAVFTAGTQVPSTFLKDLDRLVNDELYSFGAITPDNAGEGLVVLRDMHMRLGGNGTSEFVAAPTETDENPTGVLITGLLNKIRFLSEQVGSKNLILENEVLCNSCLPCLS